MIPLKTYLPRRAPVARVSARILYNSSGAIRSRFSDIKNDVQMKEWDYHHGFPYLMEFSSLADAQTVGKVFQTHEDSGAFNFTTAETWHEHFSATAVTPQQTGCIVFINL